MMLSFANFGIQLESPQGDDIFNTHLPHKATFRVVEDGRMCFQGERAVDIGRYDAVILNHTIRL